ncbi:rRNA maturation protein [Methanococcoides sp. AM1]|uniref:rRNA maturation protein n=1 Tax=Methanococcoides sp. AM1 TaxID=1201011 RepID=UPI00108361FA|nr:rRNA maturation protein [Methanococcoides sp. AM1]
MLITSSRKPSANTRTLCKYLASFFNCEYLTRGKMGLADVMSYSDDTNLVVVGDYHGSPGSLIFYDEDGAELLSIRLSIFYPDGYKFSNLKSMEPVLMGDGELGNMLSHYLGIPNDECDGMAKCIRVEDDRMEFLYSGKLLFRLNVKSYRVPEAAV